MMGGDTSAETTFGSQHHRDFGFAAEHITVVCADVNELVHCYGKEIDIHNFGNGSDAPQSCTDGTACDGCFGYCGINDSFCAEFGGKPAGCLIGTAVKADIFAKDDDVFVPS